MNKDYPPYDIALAMKELGFDWEDLFGFYAERDGEYLPWGKYEWDTCGNTGHWKQTDLEAPLYQQAFRWFREKYGYYARPALTHLTENTFGYSILNPNLSPTAIATDRGLNSYEEAELECLKKLIEIVKNNHTNDNKRRWP